MTVVAAALVPSAPLLLPAVTGPDTADLADLRRAVHSAIEVLTSRSTDGVIVAARHEGGHLAGFGAPGLSVEGAPGWAHELGCVLVSGDCEGPLEYVVLPGDDLDDLDALASEGPAGGLPGRAGDRLGVLVLGDGSATRGPRAPGGDDPRGEAVDAELATALSEGRPPRVDAATADALKVRGLPAFTLAAWLAREHSLVWEVLHASAPAGVGYVVGLTRPSRHP